MSAEARYVARWMTKNVRTVAPTDPVVDAFEIMFEHRIRHIPVIESGRLVGILSDRDVRPFYPKRGDFGQTYGEKLMATPVAEVMTKRPRTVDSATTVREAAQIICQDKIGALPVVDDDTLVGIVSAEDVLWAFVEHADDLRALDG